MVIRPALLFSSALLGVGIPTSAQDLSAQEVVVNDSKGTVVKSPSEEAAWWAGLSMEYKEKLSQLFYPHWFEN